jgi:hypothetical protein
MRCCLALIDLVCDFDHLQRHPKLQCGPEFLPHLSGGGVGMGLPMGVQVSVTWARYGVLGACWGTEELGWNERSREEITRREITIK